MFPKDFIVINEEGTKTVNFSVVKFYAKKREDTAENGCFFILILRKTFSFTVLNPL